jgi:hypothetical protein
MKKNATLFMLAIVVILVVVFGALSLKGNKSLLRPTNTSNENSSVITNTSDGRAIDTTDIEVEDLDEALDGITTVEQDLEQPTLEVDLNIEG